MISGTQSKTGLAHEDRPSLTRRTGLGRLSRQERLAYRMLVPVLGTIFVVMAYPLLVALHQSVTNATGAFVGLNNYGLALRSPLLYQSLRATGQYAAIVLPCEILFGLGFALLVHRVVRRPGLRALFYVLAIIPLVVPPVAVGVVARLIYAPGYGVLNQVLNAMGLIQGEIRWLGDPLLAMLSVASADIWQWMPFVYIVLFAGLQTVPTEAVEAAQVDGASGWGQFWYIELPYLRPLFVLILFFRLADVLRAFDAIFILTGGGPGNTTQLLSLFLYQVQFKFSQAPQAAALAVLVMLVISLLYSFVTRLLPLERA
jgi:multiple sugar transport system permease protein